MSVESKCHCKFTHETCFYFIDRLWNIRNIAWCLFFCHMWENCELKTMTRVDCESLLLILNTLTKPFLTLWSLYQVFLARSATSHILRHGMKMVTWHGYDSTVAITWPKEVTSICSGRPWNGLQIPKKLESAPQVCQTYKKMFNGWYWCVCYCVSDDIITLTH